MAIANLNTTHRTKGPGIISFLIGQERWDNILVGLLLIILGGGVTLVAYMVTEPGAEYWVFWGLIGVGLFKVLKGLATRDQ